MHLTKLGTFGLVLILLPIKNLHAESLSQIYQLASINSPSLNAERELYLSAVEGLPAAKLKFLPSLSLDMNKSCLTTNKQNVPSAKSDEVNLNLGQDLFNAGTWINFHKTNIGVQKAGTDLLIAEQNLLQDVIRQYLDVLKAQNNLEFARGQRKSFNESLNQARLKLKVGLIASVDLEQAKARFDSAHALEIEANANLNNSREALQSLTLTPIRNIQGFDLKKNIRPLQPMETYLTKAGLQNLSLISERANVKLAKQSIALLKSNQLPKVSLMARLGRSNNTPSVSRTTRTAASINLSLPLLNSGTNVFDLKASKRAYAKTAFEYEAVLQSVELQVRQTYRNIISLQDKIKALSQALSSNRLALKMTKLAFGSGTKTVVDVLDAETLSLQAKQNLASAEYDLINAQVNLNLLSNQLKLSDIVN